MTRPQSELAHLFRQLKAPAAAAALPKLADRARAEEWSYEQFAAALLKTETDSRDSHGGELRIRAASSRRARPSRTSIRLPAAARSVLHLGKLDFLRENDLRGRRGPASRTWHAGIRACQAGAAWRSRPRPNGSTVSPTRNETAPGRRADRLRRIPC